MNLHDSAKRIKYIRNESNDEQIVALKYKKFLADFHDRICRLGNFFIAKTGIGDRSVQPVRAQEFAWAVGSLNLAPLEEGPGEAIASELATES